MWRVGREPDLRMMVGILLILDRPPARSELVLRVERAAIAAPRLRWRPDDPTGTRIRPSWLENDQGVDPEQHVRTVAAPSPGDQRQVLDLVALLECTPLATNHPPWDITVIDGLEGGRAALYLRAHHVICDGMGGVSLASLLLDDLAGGTPSPADAGPVDGGLIAVPTPIARRRGTLTVTLDVRDVVRPLAAGVSAALGASPLDSAVRRLQHGVDVVHSVSRQVVLGMPSSSVPPSGSTTTRYEVASVPRARSAALALGGSRNDLLVTVAAAALGHYYDRLGFHCPELRLATPTSRHRDGDAGGNFFTPLRIEIPTGSAHPGPHFGVVASRLAEGRAEPAIDYAGPLATALSRLPNRLLLPVVRAQASSIDFIATALPGLRRSRTVAGAVIEASYPFGPRMGCPVNLTAFGNEGRLDIGISLDPVAISEPDVFLECLDEALSGFVLQRTGPMQQGGGAILPHGGGGVSS